MTSAMCDNQNFDSSVMNLVTELDLLKLLEYFSKNNYGAKGEDNEANSILERCAKLLEIDYSLLKVSNKNGELCPQYPSQLLILEYENGSNQNISSTNNCCQSTQRITDTIYESIDLQKIREQFNKARYARCRLRFPVPTILYRGKYVCRSSTLSGGPEIYGRSGLDYFLSGNTENSKSDDEVDSSCETESDPSDWQLFDKVRSQDIKLLKRLNVGTIVDLMVEKKKMKFGLYVTSSEKVDKENRYSDFNIISLPYPGCEFFKEFREHNYTAEGLRFDWNQEQCDANISVPDNPLLRHLRIEWDNYKQWDLVFMTQNYIKYLLKYLQDNTSGILIHCISGWDRTPLFISLLRLCLWADGLIHQGLDESQILYLTIAYDWMLFGHCLSDRIVKGEEIFFFCFYMLKYLTTEDFSVAHGRPKYKKFTEKMMDETSSSSKSDFEPLGDLLLEKDHLGGSNLSLNSIGSSVSNKSQEFLNWYQPSDESNGNSGNSAMSLDVHDTLPLGASSSPQARRTSPVTVPSGTRLKRTDSSTTSSSVHSSNSNNSSNSAGSWQFITKTGSLRGSDSASNCGDIPFAHTSVSTIVDGDECSQECPASLKRRTDRLVKVRGLFYGIYFKSLGKDVRMGGPEPSLGAMICNVVQKVFPKDPK